MASQSDVATQIVQALAATEPDLDTSVGSVTRKIIDAVASQIADASLSSQLLTYQYDIDSKIGSDLDAFVQLFGMSRYPAKRASGTVTFTRGTAADVIAVPVNSQVSTPDGSVIVQTLSAAILGIGVLSAAVPVQSVIAGPAGNVAPGSLTLLQTPVPEITAVTNTAALTGGTNQETDSQLQARWKATVFKSMAGTEQMFLGIALNHPECTAANVVGASKRRREQVQIASGAASSTVTDAVSTYPSGQVAGRDIDNGDVAVPGLQYTWNYAANPPQIVVIDSSYFPDGEVVDLDFAYIPVASRNDLASGITNRVDVWCAGTNPVAATQSVMFRNSVTFSSSSSSTWYTGNFVRPDGTPPAAGNVFIPLAFGPILTMIPEITIGATTYGLATAANPLGTVASSVSYAYQIIHRAGASGYGPWSDFGLEWVSTMQPANGSPFSILSGYTYNSVPSDIQNDLTNWRLASLDAIAHQAQQMLLQFSLAVIYDPSVAVSVTNTAITAQLSTWLATLGFNAIVYPSSVIQQVENTPGVIASRFITAADISGYNSATPNAYNVGIQQLSPVSSTTVISSFVNSLGDPLDVVLGDMSVPALGNVVTVQKASNTMSAFA